MYPMVFGVPFIEFATPSFPGAPMPVGHGTDFDLPTLLPHSELTLER